MRKVAIFQALTAPVAGSLCMISGLYIILFDGNLDKYIIYTEPIKLPQSIMLMIMGAAIIFACLYRRIHIRTPKSQITMEERRAGDDWDKEEEITILEE